MRRVALLLFLFSVGFAACKKPDDGGSGGTANYDFSALDQLIEDSLAVLGNDVVVILQKDGERIYEKSWGTFNPDTKKPVASCSKLPSAMVLLTLIEDGTLTWDGRIGDIWPAMNGYGKGDMTIRQLFSLVSGIKEGTALSDPLLSNNSLTLQESADSIAEVFPFWFTPETRFTYGGAAMRIAGATAEVASGETWQTLFQDRLNGPVGHTLLDANYGIANQKNPAGSMVTSANAYLDFLELIRRRGDWNGTQVIRATLIDSLFLWQHPSTTIYYSPYPHEPPNHPYDADTIRYGFGCWLDVVNPSTGSVEQISSAGAFGTYPWVDRTRGLTGIIFTFVSDGALTRNTQFKALHLIRQAVDAVHGAP